MTRLLSAAFLALLLSTSAYGQPYFEAENIRLHGSPDFYAHSPGTLVWIFGSAFTSGESCVVKNSMDESTYQTTLCDTQVLVGGIKAKLAAVNHRQINLVLPHHPWSDEFVPIQIIHKHLKSEPVPVFFGSTRPVLSFAEKVYTGMPIWVQITKTWKPNSVRYPLSTKPWDFEIGEFEVKYKGKPLSRIVNQHSSPTNGLRFHVPGTYTANLLHRLPLHLVYALDQPGSYLVRYTEYWVRRYYGHTEKNVIQQSDWSPIEVHASSSEQRSQWLKELTANPPTDTAQLLADYLPSLLAARNEAGIRLLAPYLQSKDNLVEQHAKHALYYFSPALRQKIVQNPSAPQGGVR